MALTSKKYESIHSKTGTELTKIKANFDNDHHEDLFQFEPEAALLYQIQKMQEELDYLRTEISSNKGKSTFPGFGTSSNTALAGDTTTISTAQANAITANTAKTGITSTQATSITDNTTSIASNKASISTNTNDIKSQSNNVNLLIVNKLEVIPDVNSSNNQRLTCGVTQSRGVYSLGFTFTDVDKSGKTFTKTGSIQLK